VELKRLLVRADAQLQRIEECHASAVTDAFAASGAHPAGSPSAR
jgi:hypothetical protein